MPDKFNEIALVSAALSIVFVALSGIIIFVLFFYQKKRYVHKQQLVTMQNTFAQELLKTQLETQDYTFHQISEELHDNVGQLLSTTKMLIGITERNLQYTPDSLKTASETLGKAIHDLRSLSKSLSNEWLHLFNIVDNLKAELDRLNAARQVTVKFNTNSPNLPLEPQQQVMLFRVMQEALQNCIKHAQATEIGISIKLEENGVYLCLADNGQGFDAGAGGVKNGLGIMNMRHRIKLLGGTIEWVTNINNGTKVEVWLPVQKPGI